MTDREKRVRQHLRALSEAPWDGPLSIVRDSVIERLLNVARGCHDYGGGYREKLEQHAFHHGIDTVINALKAASKYDSNDLQVQVLEMIGRNIKEREEAGDGAV